MSWMAWLSIASAALQGSALAIGFEQALLSMGLFDMLNTFMTSDAEVQVVLL